MNESPERSSRTAPGSRPPSRLVVAGRLLLLTLAAGAVALALVVGRQAEPAHDVANGRRFTCPMHPQVFAPAAGSCPICGMALVRPGEAIDLHPYEVRPAWPRIFSKPTRAAAWLEAGGTVSALLYADEIAALAPGQRGTFSPAGAPEADVEVRLAGDRPEMWDDAVARVRFHVEPGQRLPAAGDAGWLRLVTPPREAIPVPLTAIIQSPQGPYLLVEDPNHSAGSTFIRRPVRLGRTRYGMAVVVSGLRPQERVAMRSAFFLDAERRLAEPP